MKKNKTKLEKNKKKQLRKRKPPKGRKPIVVFIDKKTYDELNELINRKGGSKLNHIEKAITFFCEKVEKLI